MANRHIKRIPASDVITELQIMIYHYTPIRMYNSQNTDNTYCWWGYGAREVSFIAGENAKWYTHFWKIVWQFYKAEHNFHYTSQISNWSQLLIDNDFLIWGCTYFQVLLV